MILAVLAHEPCHNFMIRSHIGRWNIRIGPKDVVYLVDEHPRETFTLRGAEGARIDGNTTFRPAIRDVDDGCLPGHQRCQRAHFVEVHEMVVAEPAFHRSSRSVVLNAIADPRG